MEFVTVGKASSDKIHVKYNDKIATFHGEIGIDYFLVLANKIEWYPNKKATINEKIELMTIANKTFLGEKRLYFIADDAIWFDWKGYPLIVIENNIIKSMKISCVCEVLAEVDEFNDISDFCYLKKYIAELKKAIGNMKVNGVATRFKAPFVNGEFTNTDEKVRRGVSVPAGVFFQGG